MPDTDCDAQPFNGPREYANALCQLLATAKRKVRIASQQLEYAVYHDPKTVQALSDFARRSRYSRVEILLADPLPLRERPHRMVPLIQRLGSYIQLRCLQENNALTAQEYALGDDEQFLLVADPEHWRGIYQPYNRQRVSKLDDQFAQGWIYAREDPNLRQLQL